MELARQCTLYVHFIRTNALLGKGMKLNSLLLKVFEKQL